MHSVFLRAVKIMTISHLGLSPESVVYVTIGSDRIVIAEFSTEINLKSLSDALSVRYFDVTRLDEQSHLAKKGY